MPPSSAPAGASRIGCAKRCLRLLARSDHKSRRRVANLPSNLPGPRKKAFPVRSSNNPYFAGQLASEPVSLFLGGGRSKAVPSRARILWPVARRFLEVHLKGILYLAADPSRRRATHPTNRNGSGSSVTPRFREIPISSKADGAWLESGLRTVLRQYVSS